MRYFEDRIQAGRLLSKELEGFKTKNTVVVSLSEGGVVVGAEIAKKLHASLFMISTENISLPGEPKAVATLSSSGTFTYNSEYSPGELEEINMDYHTLIEQNRLEAFHKLNRIASEQGTIPKTMLKGHVVILVSDGFKNALSLDVAADFFKPVRTQRMIVAVPVASVPAVDRMHLLAYEIHCLGVIEDYMNTDHYYKNNNLPEHQKLVEMMDEVVLNWENPTDPELTSISEQKN
jgi:putative phosphoribosyl transferase